MDSNIQRKIDVSPASFIGIERTSWNTKCILNLLNTHIKENKVITKTDICKCYVTCIFKGCPLYEKREYDYTLKMYKTKIYTYENYLNYINRPYFNNSALQWFKTNLGSAIMKGKILAIPVIDSN